MKTSTYTIKLSTLTKNVKVFVKQFEAFPSFGNKSASIKHISLHLNSVCMKECIAKVCVELKPA